MTMLIELSDAYIYRIKIRYLIGADHWIFLTKEHDFWANDTKNMGDFEPAFLIN